MKMSLHTVSFILLLVGGLNWLLVGLGGFLGGDWNVVKTVLGSWPTVESLVYILVGLSAVYEITSHKGRCKECSSGGMI